MDVKPRERKQKWTPPGRGPLLRVSYLLNLGGISSDHLRQISATVRDSLVLQTHGNSPSSLNPIFFQHVLRLYYILVITTLVSNSYLTEYTPSPSFIKINHNYYYSKWLIDISDALYRPGHLLERMKVEGQHGTPWPLRSTHMYQGGVESHLHPASQRLGFLFFFQVSRRCGRGHPLIQAACGVLQAPPIRASFQSLKREG